MYKFAPTIMIMNSSRNRKYVFGGEICRELCKSLRMQVFPKRTWSKSECIGKGQENLCLGAIKLHFKVIPSLSTDTALSIQKCLAVLLFFSLFIFSSFLQDFIAAHYGPDCQIMNFVLETVCHCTCAWCLTHWELSPHTFMESGTFFT